MELLETSSPTRIVLGSVTTETGGEYKCEVRVFIKHSSIYQK